MGSASYTHVKADEWEEGQGRKEGKMEESEGNGRRREEKEGKAREKRERKSEGKWEVKEKTKGREGKNEGISRVADPS